MKSNWKGPTALLTSAAIYGSYGVLIKILGQELDVASQIVFRYSLAIILLIGLIFLAQVKLKIPRKSIPLLISFATLMQMSIWLFTKGAMTTTIPSLLGAFYIGTIVTGTILGSVVFRERLSRKTMVSTVIAILGLYLLSKNSLSNIGMLYGLVAGSIECITHSIRKYLDGVSRGAIALVAMGGVLVFTSIGNALSGLPLGWPTMLQTWWVGIIFAILAVLVNMTLTYGFRATPVNWGSLIMAGEIVFGSLFAWWWLGLSPTNNELVSSWLILMAIVTQNVKVVYNGRLLKTIRQILED